MNGSAHASFWDGQASIRRRLQAAGRAARVLVIAVCLAVLPVDLRITGGFGTVAFVESAAFAQGRGNGGNRGNGNRGRDERSAAPDRDDNRGGGNGRDDRGDRGGGNGRDDRGDRGGGNDRDRPGSSREDRGGPQDRSPSSRGRNTGEIDRSVTTPDSPAAAAIGRSLRQQDDRPGTAPTQEGATRVRAMVEIAKELGAQAPSSSGRIAISGPVTQEMLDVAEQAYVDAVQRAWEGHGFPWTDSSVLRTLGELEALVGALESIMQATVYGDVGPAGTQVATDVNDDGFVDINDLWDAHLGH